MVSIEELIPKDKFDTETAERLANYSYEEVKPIIPQLLMWMQDMNWPVARPVAEYLITHIDKLSADIIEILQGDDEMWKYWIINYFGSAIKQPAVLNEIKRIANTPTQSEIREGVNEVAREALA